MRGVCREKLLCNIFDNFPSDNTAAELATLIEDHVALWGRPKHRLLIKPHFSPSAIVTGRGEAGRHGCRVPEGARFRGWGAEVGG